MRTQLKLIICLAAAALFFSACSSTTVVARDERPAAVATSEAVGTADSPSDDDSDGDPEPTAEVDDDDDEAATDDDAADDDGADTESTVDLEEAAGFGLGGAEQLASLFGDCVEDNDLACDILFQLSDFDSAEENAALTCGGRSETTVVFCTEGIDNSGDSISFDVESEGLDAIVELCTDDADMTACDFLYYRSPLESEFEEIGATCGGRVAVAVPDCRTFLPNPE